MKIGKATKKDLLGFIEIEKEFKQYDESLGLNKQYKAISSNELRHRDYKKDFLERLNRQNSFFYFARENDRYLGYVYGYIVKLQPIFKIGKLAYLDGIFVKKKFRGRKISSMLKNKFFAWLKKKNIELCQIHVASKNKKTLQIYQNWGFIIDEHRLYKNL